MTDFVLIVFTLVYIGMVLGGLPFLQLDRGGVALLGAIALIGAEAVSVEEAARAIDLPTILLLFAFMVISAQMRLGGFYDAVARQLAALRMGPAALLGALIAVSAALSAVFSNDVVCLAMAPVLVEACRRRGLDALPYLLALACSANIGSAATLIGNPQNMLIGARLNLPFGGYVLQVLPPVLLSLAATWVLIALLLRKRLHQEPVEVATATVAAPAPDEDLPFSRWQAAKGLTVSLGVLLCFLFAPWPREVVALAGAGLLLLSRRLHSRDMLGLVDWQLLVLFMGLFVVNHALQATGLPEALVRHLAAAGWRLDHPASLFGATFVLSNLVSNVPAVMLLLPLSGPDAGPLLALVSTLAGNLFIVGSIANIIVVDAAARHGVTIDWRTHARIGVPVTMASLAISAGWLALRA
ncbi:anion transporter [uncultured Azohydromonas sp.]|jgi:Na+/H+ antiporter NhaD and related arsenite permeases|uniref:anion transporter n=1 Tax=uncultured Azohydromonas sp. TaxID=487342 RepID=UPI0026198656|nr:anion transporter [uncultured Azohydromonas sp.]